MQLLHEGKVWAIQKITLRPAHRVYRCGSLRGRARRAAKAGVAGAAIAMNADFIDYAEARGAAAPGDQAVAHGHISRPRTKCLSDRILEWTGRSALDRSAANARCASGAGLACL